ncbi:ankyrin [Byssothecium circinans]|uniref:Ankyrin n=1 Tax=Byssothecium circinans TaxID=147558 RepID=A0A6A5TWS1_9PLEO|nr:ankyrin [Byssothecium circinans]
MAPTRPPQNQNHATKHRARRSAHGSKVQKRKKSPREDAHMGRGRKNTWGKPWLKRLITLCGCGIPMRDALEVLNILSNGKTSKKMRTAQDNLKRMLGKDFAKLRAYNNKEIMRQRLHFLKTAEQHECDRSPSMQFPQPLGSEYSSVIRSHATTSVPASTATPYHKGQIAHRGLSPTCFCVASETCTCMVTNTTETILSPFATNRTFQYPATSSDAFGSLFKNLDLHADFQSELSTTFDDWGHNSDLPDVAGWPWTPSNKDSMMHPKAYDITGAATEKGTTHSHHMDITIEGPAPDLCMSTSIERSDGTENTSLRNVTQPSDETRSIGSNASAKIYRYLQGQGYTASLISLIKTGLKRRYSVSSFGTSTRRSVSEASFSHFQSTEFTLPSEWLSPEPTEKHRRPDTILDVHALDKQRRHHEVTLCCLTGNESRSTLENKFRLDNKSKLSAIKCIHELIIETIVRNSPESILLLDTPADGPSIEKKRHTMLSMINSRDVVGRNALFFTASQGASLDVLEFILHKTDDVNAVDINGQSFLFHLDLSGIAKVEACHCYPILGCKHVSAFECLMKFLKLRCFDFEHLDKDNKSFLSWLCASQHFNIEWLCRLMEGDVEWVHLVVTLAGTLDTTGLSFVDRLNSYGRNLLTESVQTILGASSPTLEEWKSAIYTHSGRTRVHHMLSAAYHPDGNDTIVLRIARHLYYQCASLDTASLNGKTPLIWAAENLCLDTLDFLLSLGVSTSPKDDTGSTALDYAYRNYKASRKARVSATRTGESMRAIADLLNKAMPLMVKSTSATAQESRSNVGWETRARDSAFLLRNAEYDEVLQAKPRPYQVRRYFMPGDVGL